MRRLGKGYQGSRKFLTLMNHPPPMTERNFRKLSNKFNNARKNVAKHSMQKACLQNSETHEMRRRLLRGKKKQKGDKHIVMIRISGPAPLKRPSRISAP